VGRGRELVHHQAGSPVPRQLESPKAGQGGGPGPDPSPSPRQGACSGVLRGIGKQKFGAILNTVSYYGVGLPLGVVLLFVARIGIIGTDPRARSSAWPQTPPGRVQLAPAPPTAHRNPPRDWAHWGDWDGPCNY